jgi:hypothetical protein
VAPILAAVHRTCRVLRAPGAHTAHDALDVLPLQHRSGAHYPIKKKTK